MRHLIDLSEITRSRLDAILNSAETEHANDIPGRPVAGMLFLEPSTRTRTSFEMAARHCGVATIRLDYATSAMNKGESLNETVATLGALGLDFLIIRSSGNNDAANAAAVAGEHGIRVINAGSGIESHPTQALGDALALQRRLGKLDNIRVGVAGDIQRSRVARSFTEMLRKYNKTEVLFASPNAKHSANEFFMGSAVYPSIESMPLLDAVMILRLQKERGDIGLYDEKDYDDFIRIDASTPERMRCLQNTLLMHPGPEVGPILPQNENNLVAEQVRAGVAVREAVFRMLFLDRG